MKTKPINSILKNGINNIKERSVFLSLIIPSKTSDIKKTKKENSNPTILIIEILGFKKIIAMRGKISFLNKTLSFL